MKSLKAFILLGTFSLLASCGNPHLVAKDLALETHIVPMVQSALAGVEITVPGSVEKRLQTGYDSKSATSSAQNLIVTNLDKVVYEISYSFEKGENFRFSGGSFPGLKGDCAPKLIALGQCQVDIEFFADKSGKYTDTLKVVYYVQDDQVNAITITFPLEGEKTQTKEEEKVEVKFAEIANQDLDMGAVRLGQSSIKMLEVTNSGNAETTLNPQFDSPEFSFTGGVFPGTNGTCQLKMVPGSCLIEVNFTPKSQGSKKARLSFSYESKQAIIELKGSASPSTCTVEKTLTIRPRAKGASTDVIFPFLSSHPKTTAKLGILYGTEANYRIDNYYTVKDAQVYVSYDLPVIDGTITDINLNLNVLKVVFDSYKDTEMLCLSTPSLKRCSGHKFALEAWNTLINKNFWKGEKAPVNALYEEMLIGTEKKCGARSCMTFNTPVHFTDVFSLDKVSLASLAAERRLNLIISDDTRLLTMPTMEVTVKKETSCVE